MKNLLINFNRHLLHRFTSSVGKISINLRQYSKVTAEDLTKSPAEIKKQKNVQANPLMARFEFSPKQVNLNIASQLIADVAPMASEDRVVHCDGGHAGLGHPRIYINLDKPGTHACGYCGLRFYNSHSTKPSDLNTSHIQV